MTSEEDSDLLIERFYIPGEEQIPAIIVRPRGVSSPPAIINLHGQGGQVSKENALPQMKRAAALGVTVVGIDARLHGERRDPDLDTSGAVPVLRWYEMARGTAIDVSAVAAYLLARPELCNGRLGLRGFSFGGCVALSVASLDRRFDPILAVGTPVDFEDDYRRLGPKQTDPAALRAAITAFDPATRLDAFYPRNLMLIYGERDEHVSLAEQRLFYDQLAPRYGEETGRLILLSYPGEHHPPPQVQDIGWHWLARTLLSPA